MKNVSEISTWKLLIVLILVFGFSSSSCKRSIPYQGRQANLNETQRITIDEPICAPSRNTIIKGNVYISVDTLPEFPGGESKLHEFVETHIQYPAEAHGAAGRVNVMFVINRDGILSDFETVGSKKNPALEKEAIRIMKSSPKWKPGKINGKKVRVQYTVPILFLPPQALPSYHRPE